MNKGTMRPLIRSRRRVSGLIAGLLFVTLPAFAATPAKLSGALAGSVTNATGIPQMGATVLVFNRQERLCERALTDADGKFSFASLLPDVYSIRVSLPAFVTAFKDNILVQPGVRSLLNVSLANLFSSIQVVAPAPGERSVMSEDWKWVLRTASATRPVMRVLPGWDPGVDPNGQRRHTTTVFSDTRGLVRVSGGDGGQVSGYGDAADLGTAFALATSLFGANQLQVSGNLGYTPQSGMPSAGFRTTYSRSIGGVSPEVSLTMRQMYLPRIGDALAGGPSAGGVPALRTMALDFANEATLSERLRLQYGFSLDSVTFLDRLHYFSPYARLSYALGQASELDFAFTSGNGRPDLAREGASPDVGLQQDINALSRVPRVSLAHGRAQVQRGDNFELGYSRVVGSRTYRLSGYREEVSNAALTIVAPGGLYSGGDILPDMFSNSSIFNAGNYHTLGYTASVTQKLGDRMNVSLMYGSVGVLTPQADVIASDDPEDLRRMIRSARRSAVTTRTVAVIPGIGTHVIASYQWMDQRSATPGQLYSTEQLRPDPGLNIYVRQPIPSGFNLPWRMEATADLRNMLAQGYLPLSLADGRRILLIQNPRSFRGGLSFIF
jgi:hypothetical protein